MKVIANGPDLSSVQGNLTAAHWGACAKVSDFAIFKCGEGNKGFDPTYGPNIIGARHAGLTVGTYHFVYVLPDKAGHPGRSPEEQAEAHFKRAVYMPGDLIPWADFEWPAPQDMDTWELPKGGRADFIGDFMVRYTSHYSKLSGVLMGIYSYPYWLDQTGVVNTDSCETLCTLPFWRAGPYVHSQPSVMPGGLGPFLNCSIYQWTGGAARLPNGAPSDWNICLQSTLDSLSILASRK